MRVLNHVSQCFRWETPSPHQCEWIQTLPHQLCLHGLALRQVDPDLWVSWCVHILRLLCLELKATLHCDV